MSDKPFTGSRGIAQDTPADSIAASYKPFWRHERPGSYLLARIICRLFGHDAETWETGLDIDGTFVADEDAVEFATVRGDCRRCWG